MELEPVKSTGAVQIDSVRQKTKAKSPAPEQIQQPRHTAGVSQANVPIFYVGGKATATSEEKEDAARERQLKSAITQVNSKIKSARTRCEYSSDNAINRIAIKVIDEETGDIIKEIPPEDTIKMIEKLWEVAGILVDKKL